MIACVCVWLAVYCLHVRADMGERLQGVYGFAYVQLLLLLLFLAWAPGILNPNLGLVLALG